MNAAPAEWQGILLLAALALATGLAAVYLFAPLRPRRPTPVKTAPYECGMVPFEEAKGEVPVPYYAVAMVFLLFDVEVAFLYPWLVAFSDLPAIAHIEVALFVAVLAVGLLYAFRVGAFDWNR